MAKSAYQLWKEAKEKETQRKAEGKIHFKEDSRASRVQTTLPQYSGQSKDKNYKWETDLLKPLSIKQYGRSYNDKFSKYARSQGMNEEEYRKQLDFEEDRKKEGHYAYGAMYETEVLDGILNDMRAKQKQNFAANTQRAQAKKAEEAKKPKEVQQEPKKKTPVEKDTKDNPVLNGLFKALEILDRPGDAVRTGIKEKAEGNGFWEGAKDGFLGKKDTSGKEVNKAIGFDTTLKGIPQEIAKFVARGFVGQGPTGKVYTPVVNDKIATKVGTETLGIGTELVTDPLNYIGVGLGKGAAKGIQTASNRTMQNLLPSSSQMEEAVKGLVKANQAEHALPVARPNFDELIPRGNDITNPNYVPSLKPTPKPQIEVPKVGTSLDEALANPKPIAEPVIPKTPKIASETPVNTLEPQVNIPKQPGERSFYSTVQNPEKLSPELEQLLNDFDKTYKPMSNEETVKFANEYIKKDMEKAYQFVKNAEKFDPRHVTVGHRLIDELQKVGDYNKALDVVERLAEQGTKAGQSIQSFSIYNRLSAEGQLLRAQRRVNKINETIADPAKQIKLTEQNIQDITHTADSIQRFTGQKELANDVMKIMDNIKKGNQPTDGELDVIRSFVSDAKKFVGDLDSTGTPKTPKAVKDVRTRDKVVDFMDRREALAREELKKIFGRANSLPVDAFYHLAVIGASKIAKGTVKLSDFTEEMVKEFGEAVRPYANQIYNKAVETFNLQSEAITRQRLSEVEKITNKALKDKNLSAEEAEEIREFARRVGQMSGEAKLDSSMELQTILQTLERPTFGQKLSTAQTIAQLLNSKTIVRNALGNEMFYRVEQINKLMATPIDIARSKITGGERTITFVSNNQGQYWRNWLTGAKAGWKGVNPMGLTTAYDLGPQAFRSKWNPLTYLEKSLGATLRSFDHAGYMRAYNKTIGEMATLRAVNEGLQGAAKKEAIARYIREADENMIQIADQYGKYATFQDNTMLSTALTKVKKGMNKVSTLGATEDFGLGDLVLKYPKTPGNLIMRALEYSPAGVVRSAHLLKNMAKTKNPAEIRDFWLSLTRAITGTGGFSLLGYVLADKGILTPGGSSDYELSSLEKNAGKQPHSVNISALGRFITSGLNLEKAGIEEGDTFVSYDWAQPISMAISLGTGVSQSVKENGELSLGGATKGAFDSATNTIINSSVLKGVNDFLANYPGRTMSDRIGDAAKGALGSFVPTLSNQFRQIGDNAARTTYSPNLLPEIKNRAINRIPLIEKTLPPAYDTLGNERQTYQNNGNNLFNVFLNPSFVSKYNPSSEAEFVLNAINETGDKNLAPRMAQKKLDGKPLTSEQYVEMQRIMGEEVRAGLSEIMYMEGGNPEEVSKAIEKVLREAGKVAREAIRSQRGE